LCRADIQAYDSLWDDIIKQFLQHTDQTVLTSAIQAINELTLNTSLANNNTAKLNELTESLFTSLRDAINGQDVSSMSIDDEEVITIQAILFRLTLLGKSRDITEVMEDEEGGQSSGWEIVCAFAERGELPYKDEAKVCPSLPLSLDLGGADDRSSNMLSKLYSYISPGCSRASLLKIRTIQSRS
jgi:cohesin complex subunit SA-1/2